MIDIIKLYNDFNISHSQNGHRPWIHIQCPFCGDHKQKLGYCTDPSSRYAGAYTCWRCGGKNVRKVLSTILNLPSHQVKEIIERYSGGATTYTEKKEQKKAEECHLPAGTTELTKAQRQYLIDRNFDPDYLAKTWGIKGTGPVGPYKHRIIIPIYFEHQLVSYQGRDITGKSSMKYKACPSELEKRDHKHCLYGEDLVEGDTIVVCEGVTDVWRLGPRAVATFGIKYTLMQMNLLTKYKHVFILYDNDPQAVEQAEILASFLSTYQIDCEIIDLVKGDPADLSVEDARQLMNELKGE